MQDALFRIQETAATRNAEANAKTHMIFMKLKSRVVNNLSRHYIAKHMKLTHNAFQQWKLLSTKHKLKQEIET